MADTVKVRLLIGAREGKAGDDVEVSAARARQMFRGSVAQPATKPAAKKAGVAPETAATAQKPPSTGKSGS